MWRVIIFTIGERESDVGSAQDGDDLYKAISAPSPGSPVACYPDRKPEHRILYGPIKSLLDGIE